MGHCEYSRTEGGATWNQYASGSNWATAGAGGSTDRGSTVLGTMTASGTGTYTINLNTSGKALVQSWINTPSTNYGARKRRICEEA